MEPAGEIRTRRRIEPASGLLIAITIASLCGTAWLRFRSGPDFRPATVGGRAPLLQMLDLNSNSREPMIMVGLRGKVVWVVFWSAESLTGSASLPVLEEYWKRFKGHGRFSMVSAAVEADQGDRVRAIVSAQHVKLPVWLATADTRRRFGADHADPPVHVLIDSHGQIVLMARGGERSTLDRIAAQARGLLDAIDPLDEMRFAAATVDRPHAGGPTAAAARRLCAQLFTLPRPL